MSDLPPPPGPSRRYLYPSLLAMRDPLKFLQDLSRQHGPVVQFRLWKRKMVLVNEPELIRDVLITHAAKFEKGVAGPLVRDFFGDSLLTSQGAAHRRQRRMVQPAFHRTRIAGYTAAMTTCAEQAMAGWSSGEERDVLADMTQLTLEVIGRTMFSTDVSREGAEALHAIETLLSNLDRLQTPLSQVLLRLPLPFSRRVQKARDTLDQIIYRLIRERRALAQDRGDLLSMLILAEDADHPGEHLSDIEVRDQLMTIFLAGHQTIADCLSWTWWLLANHPEVEQRLHQELDTTLTGNKPGMADIARLSYLEKIIRESMRLYPPAWTIGRMTIVDHALGGYHIPKGTILLMSQWVTHRDERFFERPTEFNPDRWTQEFEDKLEKFAYFPFSGGPRICIGEGFAWMELSLIAATIGQKWRFALSPATSAVPLPRMALRPRGALRLRLQSREPAVA